MANVHGDLQLTVTFNQQEFRLVTLALAGKIQKGEDVKACLQLNTKLSHQRFMEASQAQREAEKALDCAAALQQPQMKGQK